MQLDELLKILSDIAPLSLAEQWDNPGLLVEPLEREIKTALVALDCTVDVVHEAKERGAQIVLAHHPLFFKPAQSLFYSRPETAAAYWLAHYGIGMYAAHTNLDCALNGVNDALAGKIGLSDIGPLQEPDREYTETTAGRLGRLQKSMPLRAFAAYVRDTLHTAVRYGGSGEELVQTIAVVGGSGADYMKTAKQAGADVLLTGECKHDAALSARVLKINIVEAGHYETEHVVLEPWIAGLQQAAKGVQCNVDFILASSGHAPLIAP
jgi:dinuclear metal center YbgI/SA1388 family protein